MTPWSSLEGAAAMRARVREMRKSTLSLGEYRLADARGLFDVHFFRDLANETTAMAISTGPLDLAEPLLARVHSSCVTSECLMGRDCDCSEQLEGALATMAAAGRGVVFYLMQEGRGAGLTAKARDRMMVQASGNRLTTFDAYASMGLPADLRSYEVVAPMARMLGVRAPVRLLTNNPDKMRLVAKALEEEKIEVIGAEPIHGPSSVFNRDYLLAKLDSGHNLDLPGGDTGAMPPGAVHVFEPAALPGEARRIVTASYYLPIHLPIALESPSARETDSEEASWFRLSVVYDRDQESESILLSQARNEVSGGDEAEGQPTEGTVTMGLLDRLPFEPRPGLGLEDDSGRSLLLAALERIRDLGRGSVAVRFDDRDLADAVDDQG